MHRSLPALLFLLVTTCSGIPRAEPFPAPELSDSLPWPVTRPPLITRRPDIDRLLEELSVRDKAAQLVMPWLSGGYAPFDDSAFSVAQGWVDSLHVGGVIVSIGSPLDIAAKLNRLQQRSYLPLLIAADLESGSGFRLTGGTPFPTNMGVAAAGSELDAYQMGRVTALEGRAVGIQIAFAPVADVNNNPANPIINTRSFGEDPAAVARLVSAEVRGMQDHGMMATVKHFPGHGNTGTDSHLALPVVSEDWAGLDSLELVPFRAAVEAGVTAVMSGHLALPAIDSGRTRPATLAPNILTGILRDSLRFRGLVVTDALDMGGVTANRAPGEPAVLAFLAGADLLVMPANPGVAIDALTRAVETRTDRHGPAGCVGASCAAPQAGERPLLAAAGAAGQRAGSGGVGSLPRDRRRHHPALAGPGPGQRTRGGRTPTAHPARGPGDPRRRRRRNPGRRTAEPRIPGHRLPAVPRQRAGQLRLGADRDRGEPGGDLRHQRAGVRRRGDHRPAPGRSPD